jgi:hypothetical protein
MIGSKMGACNVGAERLVANLTQRVLSQTACPILLDVGVDSLQLLDSQEPPTKSNHPYQLLLNKSARLTWQLRERPSPRTPIIHLYVSWVGEIQPDVHLPCTRPRCPDGNGLPMSCQIAQDHEHEGTLANAWGPCHYDGLSGRKSLDSIQCNIVGLSYINASSKSLWYNGQELRHLYDVIIIASGDNSFRQSEQACKGVARDKKIQAF